MDPVTLLTGAAVGFLAETLRHYIVRRRRMTRAARRTGPRYLTPENLHRHQPVLRPDEEWPQDETFRGCLPKRRR